jgi:hypothetical protein
MTRFLAFFARGILFEFRRLSLTRCGESGIRCSNRRKDARFQQRPGIGGTYCTIELDQPILIIGVDMTQIVYRNAFEQCRVIVDGGPRVIAAPRRP